MCVIYNVSTAAQAYAEKFSNRRHPDTKTIRRVVQRLVETDNFKYRKNQTGRQTVLDIYQEEILDNVEADPSASLQIVTL